MTVEGGTGEGERRDSTELLRALRYVVVDVETTGGSPARGDRITEVAALCVDGDGRVVDEFQTLINPQRSIPPFITRITRITNAMVRDAPRFGEVADELRRRLAGRIFVAHNVSFDWRFVGSELEWATGIAPDCRRLCTVRLARRVVPEVARRSLDSLSDYFGIQNQARHRAYGDALATVSVFRRLLERLEERDVFDWQGLETLLGRRSRRKKRRALPTSVERA